jgi:hypothetical protein
MITECSSEHNKTAGQMPTGLCPIANLDRPLDCSQTHVEHPDKKRESQKHDTDVTISSHGECNFLTI